MAHQARKRFGQHFLTDDGVISVIIKAIRPLPGETLVEIGPGLGALTQPLLHALPHLHVVEIDRDVIATLRRKYPPEQLTIHAGDALKFDFASIAKTVAQKASSGVTSEDVPWLRVCGNLPYNISTPLLFHLANFAPLLIDGHFMLQKEVVERMVAAPSSKAFGRLSVMLQVRFQMESLFDVPPTAFNPPPRVDSAIVRMIPHRDCPDVPTLARLEELVTLAFSQRRKMLRATLGKRCSQAALAAANIDTSARAEDVPVEAYLALARQA